MGQPQIVPSRSRGDRLRAEDFSLVLGGPLYRCYLWTGLMRPPLYLVARRVAALSMICWLPLLVLAALSGHLTSGVADPFLRDPEVHVRFLVALPLLIIAEVIVHHRMRTIVPQFEARGIVTRQDQARFEGIVASAMRLRNSVAAEVILLVAAVTLGSWLWRQTVTLNVSSWYAVNAGGALHFTAAGRYYVFVSLVIFRFLLLRWYFRLYIWYRFLWQVRALPLKLNLYHPDRAGGLGFLAGSLPAFAPIFAAQTAVLSSIIFDHILYAGQKLPVFKWDIVVALLFFVLVIVLPLGFFVLKLTQAGRTANREFGILASRYVDDFRSKWVESSPGPEEQLLGTADIQSLADLANSFSVAKATRFLPISREDILRFIVVISLPLLPLLLTMFALDEVVKRLFKMMF